MKRRKYTAMKTLSSGTELRERTDHTAMAHAKDAAITESILYDPPVFIEADGTYTHVAVHGRLYRLVATV